MRFHITIHRLRSGGPFHVQTARRRLTHPATPGRHPRTIADTTLVPVDAFPCGLRIEEWRLAVLSLTDYSGCSLTSDRSPAHAYPKTVACPNRRNLSLTLKRYCRGVQVCIRSPLGRHGGAVFPCGLGREDGHHRFRIAGRDV